jgi:hypothetical protein
VVLLQQGRDKDRTGHAGHAIALHLQVPLWHVRPLEHAKLDPQPPQLFLSVCSLTQAPLQSV